MATRLAVDVGGTFTDIVCFDERNQRISVVKVPSTPADPSQAVVAGVRRILDEQDLSPKTVDLFLHGTTVATNTLLEHKGTRVALFTTQGFRDVLEIMRQDRPRLYDFFEQPPKPLVPRDLRFEVPERITFKGEILVALEEGHVRDLIRRLAARGIHDFAICLLHSYANPQHEERVRAWIYEEVSNANVSISSEVLSEFKEFERMSTTVVNAYVRPKMSAYLGRLEESLGSEGVPSQLHIMQSNGGLMTAQTARDYSVQTILSGPAAGALSALRIAEEIDRNNIISIDVGGTSADVALAHESKLHFAEENAIGGHVIKVPMIEIQTVGAGGGSIAWIDKGGALQVGPHSAGADPGPACYSRGGTDPTVTDAHLVLGRLNPRHLLGGEMEVDRGRAREVIEERIAKPLSLELEAAAEGILKVINAVMAKAIRRISVERGHDPRDFGVVAFGGAGPLHTVDLAIDLQIPEVIIPSVPGVGSALGLLMADFRHEHVRTLLWNDPESRLEQLKVELESLQEDAGTRMRREGIPEEDITYLPAAEMRYEGQGFALEIPFSLNEVEVNGSRLLIDRFHERHQEKYGYCEPSSPTELVNLRLSCLGKLDRPRLPQLPKKGSDPSAALREAREVFLKGNWQPVDIYERSLLEHGNRISGPAIIEQIDSTALIYPGQVARIDVFGNVIVSSESP